MRLALSLIPLLLFAEGLLQQAEELIKREQFAAAEPVLRSALKTEPGNIEALYRLGYAQFRQRKLTAARNSFTAIVNTAPPAFHSRYFLGRIALLENKSKEAITWLEPVMSSGQAVFDTPSQLASAYSAAGLNSKAASALKMAIAQTPWDGALYYRLGQLHTRAGEAELAREAFESSRRLKNANREDVGVLMRVAQFVGSGESAEAARTGAKLAEREDADPNALVALGVLYGNGKLQSEALAVFDRAADKDPKLFEAQFNRGLALLKLNRPAEAMKSLAAAVELLPQSLEANLTYGLSAVMTQNYKEAIAPLERAWRMQPDNARVGALLATSYLRTGAPSQAVTVLRSPPFRSVHEPAPLLLLVEALNGTEQQQAALESALAAQKQFPKYPQTQMAVAQQLARVGKYSEARPAFEETLKLVPGHPEAELGLAEVLQKSGEHDAALPHYKAAYEAESTSLAARTGAARSLIALRRLDDARKLLEEAVLKHPAEPALRVELSRVYARLGEKQLAAEQTQILEKLRNGR